MIRTVRTRWIVAECSADRRRLATRLVSCSAIYRFALKNGQLAYTRAASGDRKGLAYSGICFTGPALNPTKGFAWGVVP